MEYTRTQEESSAATGEQTAAALDWGVSIANAAKTIVSAPIAIGSQANAVSSQGYVYVLVLMIGFFMLLGSNYHNTVQEEFEYGIRCVARPVYLDPIRVIIETVQRIFNPTICWTNAFNWITFGVWREVVFPLIRSCDITAVFVNIGQLIQVVAVELIADFIATGNFLDLATGIYDWGPGSDPFNQPNGQAGAGTGTLCQTWQTLWTSWLAVLCCLCQDLCKFLQLQPLFIVIGLPPIPILGFPGVFFATPWLPGIIGSQQIGDEQLWRAVGHAFNAILNVFQQLWAIILHVIIFVIGGTPGAPDFPRPDFRVFAELVCLSAAAFVRSCENAAQLFIECFVPFPFDFIRFLCFVDTSVCILLKTAVLILHILINADRLGAPDNLWETRFRADITEILNRIAPVNIPGYYLPNGVGQGGPIDGVLRLSECICVFFQRLLCDPQLVCFDANLVEIPCTCYGQAIPTGILNEFSLCCIIERTLTLAVDILAALLDATYNFSDIVTYITWLDTKWLDYLDIIVLQDLVGETKFTALLGEQGGILRCIGGLFRAIPVVGFCIESLLIDTVARVYVSVLLFGFKFLLTALVTNLVLELGTCIPGNVGPETNCFVPCDGAAGQSPSISAPCFTAGWLLTRGRARNDWERIWDPLIVKDTNTDDENLRSAENCFCAIFNLIPIPRLPCTNCFTCGYIPGIDQGNGQITAGEFIECTPSPFEPVARTCGDGLGGPVPGQGIVRDVPEDDDAEYAGEYPDGSDPSITKSKRTTTVEHTKRRFHSIKGVMKEAYGHSSIGEKMSKSRKRVDELRSSLRSARRNAKAGTSPYGLFQSINAHLRSSTHQSLGGKGKLRSPKDVDAFMLRKKHAMLDTFHAKLDAQSPLEEPMRSWTKQYMRDLGDVDADLLRYAPEGVTRIKRFDTHLRERKLIGGKMHGRHPETGEYHQVDERVECSPTPGCFDLCCFFKRLLRVAVRLLIQVGDFFDAIFFGESEEPRWQYFVGPESDLFLANFEIDLIGLLVEYIGIYQCLCNIIELLFPIPFLDLCCPIIAAADLAAEVLITLIKAIKSLALDNRCLNPREVQTTTNPFNGLPVFELRGDICTGAAEVLDSNAMCCPSVNEISGITGACLVATTPPAVCSPDSDNFSYFTKAFDAVSGFTGGDGPATAACQPGDTVSQCDCCFAGQSQFECDIDRMADQTIVIVVCLCDILRAMFPIPGLDLCCASEAFLITAIETIRLVIEILVNLGTINTVGADYFKVTPPTSPGGLPGPIDEIGLVLQVDVILDSIFGMPGGRCALQVPAVVPPQFSGGEAVGGAFTCLCQVLNWIIPARAYPSLPVGTCPDDDPNCDNCPIIDLCCVFRETGFFLSAVGQFTIRFVATLWQDWYDDPTTLDPSTAPVVALRFLFCDELGEWAGSSPYPSSDTIWPQPDGGLGASVLTSPSCGQIQPILDALENIVSDCPCAIFQFVDELIALVFDGDQQCFCGETNGLFKVLPRLVKITVQRIIQFIRMFWSADFWSSPDGPPGTSNSELMGSFVPPILADGSPAPFDPLLYQNQTWARWFLLPILDLLCSSVIAFLCVPDVILGALFGCSVLRSKLVAGLVVWPGRAIVVILELVEGVANTFSGNCGFPEFTEIQPDGTQVVVPIGAGGENGQVAGVSSACIGGALVGLLQFPIDVFIADGELLTQAEQNITSNSNLNLGNDQLDQLLAKLPTCGNLGRVSGLLIGLVRYLACLFTRTLGVDDPGAQEAFFGLATFLSWIWQISVKLLASVGAFINLVISVIGFTAGDLCACHRFVPTPPNPNSPEGRYQQRGGLCYYCEVDPAVDNGVLSGNPPGTYFDLYDVFMGGTGAVLPGPDACPNPSFFTPTSCRDSVAWVETSPGSGVYEPPREETPGNPMTCSTNFPTGPLVLCSFIQILESFFQFVGSVFDIFNPPPVSSPVPDLSRRRAAGGGGGRGAKRGHAGARSDPDRGEDTDDNEPEVITPFKRPKVKPHRHASEFDRTWAKHLSESSTPKLQRQLRDTKDFIRRARVAGEKEANWYNTASTSDLLVESFAGFNTDDCETDPIGCLCRNMPHLMEDVCVYNHETGEVTSAKADGTPVTEDDVLHAVGASCAGGTTHCDRLIASCADAGWESLSSNGAMLFLWAECMEKYVTGERVHEVDSRFPSDFFTDIPSGFNTFITNLMESANRTGAQMREEWLTDSASHYGKQRRAHSRGLTEHEEEAEYLRYAFHDSVGRYQLEHPEILRVWLEIDLKFRKISSGMLGKQLRRAAHNLRHGTWKIPMYPAWLDFKHKTLDLGSFLVYKTEWRGSIAKAVENSARAMAAVSDYTRTTMARGLQHGFIWGDNSVFSHTKATLRKRAASIRAEEGWGEPPEKGALRKKLASAFYNGPAYKWWNESWKKQENPLQPFTDHIKRVYRIYKHQPHWQVRINNPAARTTLPRLWAETPNPWTAAKERWRNRWTPRWDWRLPHWPESKVAEDRWENVRAVATTAMRSYEVVYPDFFHPDTRERWLVGPGSDCSIISDSLALIVDTFSYCAAEFTFNLPPPQCLNVTVVGNTTIVEPRPDVGCARRRRRDVLAAHEENRPHDLMMPEGDTTFRRWLRQSGGRRPGGFLRSRKREWEQTNRDKHTRISWRKWSEGDEYSYYRPRIIHDMEAIHEKRTWERTHEYHVRRLVSFITTGASFYTWFFCALEDFFGVAVTPEIAMFIKDAMEWISNPNINPEDCGKPGLAGVGFKYWLLFPVRCEWPEYVNCSNPCALGLKEATKRIAIISIIVFGGLSVFIPSLLLPLIGVGGLLFYVIIIPAAAWHYSPQCWFIFPSIPIPGIGISVPILPFPIGLPVLPECLIDDLKAFLDDIFSPCPYQGLTSIFPLCLYNGDPCPQCPDRISMANCVNVGVSDGISNILWLIYQYDPGIATFIGGTLAETCVFGGCLLDVVPFNLDFIVNKFNEFSDASSTQQCRQKWCFFATIPSVLLPVVFIGVVLAFVGLIVVIAMDVAFSLFWVYVKSPAYAYSPIGLGAPNPWITQQGPSPYARRQPQFATKRTSARPKRRKRAKRRITGRASRAINLRALISETVGPLISYVSSKLRATKQKSD